MGFFAHHDIDCVVAERGGVIENYHRVHAAIVDASTGQLLYAVGNPQHRIHIRSAAKPAQALAVLEACSSSASTRIDVLLDDADIALLCASHNSEPRHIDRVRVLRHKLNVHETDLQCGPHPSISPAVQKTWIQQGLAPSAVHSNCSGKHTGMLAGARALTGKSDDYHLPEHPLQGHIRQVIQDLSGAPSPESIVWGLDGCNLPAPAMELSLAARIYGHLAAAADAEHGSADARTTQLARIFRGMTQHPEMVAGEGRFCTQLMEAYAGVVVGKVGDEACYGVGVRGRQRARARREVNEQWGLWSRLTTAMWMCCTLPSWRFWSSWMSTKYERYRSRRDSSSSVSSESVRPW